MIASGIDQRLGPVFSYLNQAPSTYSSDLDAVVAHNEALGEVFGMVRNDVYVASAVIQLENSSGYPVGHILFDAEEDAFRFIPHIDSNEEPPA